MYVYTLIYTHTRTHTYLHKSLKRISVFSQFKGHPYFRITLNTIMISLLLSVTFATRMLDVMSWINKLHSSQLKIKEAIQFKMSLKINIVSVWKEQIWGDSSISPPLFGIQVKHTSNVSGETPNWIIIMPCPSIQPILRSPHLKCPKLASLCLFYQLLLLTEGILI